MSRINRIEPSFGSVKLNPNCPNVANYLDSLPKSQALAIESMAEKAKFDKIDVYLSTIFKSFKERLVAEVGSKKYTENFLQAPDYVVYRAIARAKKIEAQQNFQNEVNKGRTRPTIK